MSLKLVDCYVIEIENKEDVQTRASGIVVVETENRKIPNFGTVIYTPTFITKKKYDEYKTLFEYVEEGDKVFFPVNLHYSYIEREENKNVKWMLVPIENIQAVWSKENGAE